MSVFVADVHATLQSIGSDDASKSPVPSHMGDSIRGKEDYSSGDLPPPNNLKKVKVRTGQKVGTFNRWRGLHGHRGAVLMGSRCAVEKATAARETDRTV